MPIIKRFFKVLICTFIAIIFIPLLIFLYAIITPKFELKKENNITFYDKYDKPINISNDNNTWVSLDDISQYFIDGLLSTEDKHFYDHNGFDYIRIVGALFKNIKSQKIVEGASTISQQYIKNMYLDFSQTWKRKIEEAYLTIELEVHYSKEEILEGYINTINFGNGNYGIYSAAKNYFNKHPKDLNIEEAAILAGIPKAPNKYNPFFDYEKSILRGKLVVKNMLINNKITNKDYKMIDFSKVTLHNNDINLNNNSILYYQDAIMNELKSINSIPSSLIESGNLKIFTNYDESIQNSLDVAVNKYLNDNDMQVASIMIEPKDGAIVALTGGKNYSISQFNRALFAKRQVGSTMKPILYYAALENGLTSSSTFSCEPTTFVFSNNKTYSPSNFNGKYANREITMAAAISLSDNIYAVKTHLFLGEDILVNVAKRMGVNANLNPDPSLALGSNEITMIDFIGAYNTLASNGYKNNPYIIRKIEDNIGNVLYSNTTKKDLVLNQNYVYIINELLTTTYNSSFKDYTTPTLGIISGQLSRKYAIKSGSTNKDFWVFGYNPNYLLGVWTGKDNSNIIPLNDAIISKKIWVEVMENAQINKELAWYKKPNNVIGIPANSISGKKENSNYVFYYLKGTENTN